MQSSLTPRPLVVTSKLATIIIIFFDYVRVAILNIYLGEKKSESKYCCYFYSESSDIN